jgi:UDP-GlcNAc:undecaprenyl-phosphate GlcNAc-1-phosphate transferase
MGDTGSLILGTIMSILVIEFNEFNIDQTAPFTIMAAPAVSFGILIYPLMDTLRVFSIRIIQKKSPFSADKNHTHHRLLVLGLNHRKATYLILAVNAIFTFAVIYFQWMGIIGLMLFNTVIGGMLLLLPSYIVGTKKLITENDPYQQIIFFGKRHTNGNAVSSPALKKTRESEKNPAKILPIKRIKEQIQQIGFW